MSLLAKTEQRPAMRGGCSLRRARRLNSSMLTRSREACNSRNDPVPAAHMLLRAKSTTRGLPSGPGSRRMSLEASPPISMIVRTWG